jgi:hypothetical protein
MNIRISEETEMLSAKGALEPWIHRNAKTGDIEGYCIIDCTGTIVASGIKNLELAREMCDRWNKFPVTQVILTDIYEYGPIKKVDGKYIVPKNLLEDGVYTCWCCGATEGEEHFTGCTYAVLADTFNPSEEKVAYIDAWTKANSN